MLDKPVPKRDPPCRVGRVTVIQKGEVWLGPLWKQTGSQPPRGPRLVHFRRLRQGGVDVRRVRPVQILRVPKYLIRGLPSLSYHGTRVERLAKDRLGVLS